MILPTQHLVPTWYETLGNLMGKYIFLRYNMLYNLLVMLKILFKIFLREESPDPPVL